MNDSILKVFFPLIFSLNLNIQSIMTLGNIVTVRFPNPANDETAVLFLELYEKLSTVFPDDFVFAPMNGPCDQISLEIVTRIRLERNDYRRICYKVKKILSVFFKNNQIKIKIVDETQ